MKKAFLSISAIILLAGKSFAQDGGDRPHIDVGRLRLGAYFAPNISWMHPTASKDDAGQYNVSSEGAKMGYTYGLMADYFFARNYAFATGLQVNTTGGKILASRVDQTNISASTVEMADFNYNLSYLEVPVALKLRTDNISGFHFFGQLGVTLGFNIGKKADYTVSFRNKDNRDSVVSGSKIKLTGGLGAIAPINLQMNIGAGAEYALQDKLSLYLGVFFNNAFLPDATNPDKYDSEHLGYQGSFKDANTRLNNFALRVGLLF